MLQAPLRPARTQTCSPTRPSVSMGPLISNLVLLRTWLPITVVLELLITKPRFLTQRDRYLYKVEQGR